MASDLKTLNRPPSLFESAQQAIRDYIRDNDLRPGSALPPENEMARRLGVGRSSVREAIKALEMIGLVETRRGTGLFVGSFSLDPVLDTLAFNLLADLEVLSDLLELRRVLETGMIGPAIQKRTDGQIAELRRVLGDMRAHASENEAFTDADREFHQVLFQNIGNKTLIKLLDLFWVTYHRASEQVNLENTDVMQTYRDHVSIVDAVEAGQVEQARASLVQHYTGIESRLQTAKSGRHNAVEGNDIP